MASVIRLGTLAIMENPYNPPKSLTLEDGGVQLHAIRILLGLGVASFACIIAGPVYSLLSVYAGIGNTPYWDRLLSGRSFPLTTLQITTTRLFIAGGLVIPSLLSFAIFMIRPTIRQIIARRKQNGG